VVVFALALSWYLQGTHTLTSASRNVLLMDTFVGLKVTGRQAEKQIVETISEMERLELLFSAHLQDSDVSKINASYPDAVAVSPEVMTVLLTAQELFERTHGTFDVTVGAVLREWGFGTARVGVPKPERLDQAMQGVGFNHVHLDPALGTVRMLHPQTRLDLGGIAKGYIVDVAVEMLSARGMKHVVVDAGGDVRMMGGRPADNQGEQTRAFRIGIQHPRQPGAIIAVVSLFDGAVLTSGDYERFFFVGDTRYSHIVDPRTGYPAQGMSSVTIVTEKAMIADAIATAAFVLGPEEGLKLINSWSGVEGMLVTEDEQIIVSPGMDPILEYQGRN